FMVLHAGIAALLTRLGTGTDITVGTPSAGRTDTALDELVGFFVNTLVLRTDTTGDPEFGALLERVRRTGLAGDANADVPVERQVELCTPARSLARNPLFQIMVVFQDAGDPIPLLPGVEVTAEPVRLPVSRFDLTFRFTALHGPDGPAGVDGLVELSTDL